MLYENIHALQWNDFFDDLIQAQSRRSIGSLGHEGPWTEGSVCIIPECVNLSHVYSYFRMQNALIKALDCNVALLEPYRKCSSLHISLM
jgi:hypothetical protein